jgi:hypothetical protein
MAGASELISKLEETGKMPPEGFGVFGGGGSSHMHSAVACALAFVAILVFSVPRRYLILTLFAAFFLIPTDQVLTLGPLHFPTMRVVILLGWVRLVCMKASSQYKFLSGRMNGIDKALLLMGLTGAVNFVLLWREWGGIINQLGELYTTLGGYFLLRFLIRDEKDVRQAIRALAYITAVIAAVMVVERVTRENPYAFLGGHRLAVLMATLTNNDRFRCWGPFGHAILAGVFGATLLPILLWYGWRSGRDRMFAFMGVIAATVMVVTSNSSTPVMAYLASVGALCLWPIRKHMRAVRWGLVLSLIPLQLVMNNPVWHTIGRLDFLGGNAWDREQLVDNFFRHIGDWWLLGTKSTADWGWSMWDLSNQFVAVGASHGLLPFIFFLATLAYAFRYIGIARKASEGDRNREWFFWALGAALFSHINAFFGTAYFDQTILAWYFLLVAISVVTAPMQKTAARRNEPAELSLPGAEWVVDSSETTVTSHSRPGPAR